MKGITRAFVFASLVSFCFSSCSETPIPRPKGYQRIEIPEASFSQIDLDCGLSLEKPQYSSVELIKTEKSGDACWFNLKFDRFNARLHCTQVEVHDNLYDLMEDAQDMVFSHDIKANGINRIRVSEEEHGTNGVRFTSITNQMLIAQRL
jgi:gliding motility-associated lipoprotein GldD